MNQLRLELCQDLSEKLGYLALCGEVKLVDGEPPEWIQLVPAGDKIEALDGRKFANKTPDAIVKAFNDDPRDLPIDWNHATELKAPKGEPAPAACWVTEMENRGGAVWGKASWTPRGAESLKTREYRYLSPAFLMNKARNILKIISAALVTRPAFDMPALAHHNQENSMDPKLLKLLGLEADATADQIAEAFEKYAETAGAVASKLETALATVKENETKLETLAADVKTANDKTTETEAELAAARKKVPGLEDFVPRKDYELATARIKTLEDSDAADKASTLKTAIDTEIDAALKTGKIVPASKDFYVATCQAEGGLEQFRSFIKDAPTVGDPSDLEGKKPPNDGGEVALTADEQRFIVQMNLTEKEYRAGAMD